MPVTVSLGGRLRARARRSIPALIFAIALLTGLTASAVAFAGDGTTVQLSVDGATRQVTVYVSTVGALLSSESVRTGPHDYVSPPAATTLRAGLRVVVRHAHRLALTLDGKRRELWVAEPTVRAALASLGVDGAGAYVAPPPATRLRAGTTAVTVRLPQHVVVLVDGHRLQPTTTAPTVAALLAQLDVRLGSRDLLTVPAAAYPVGGLVVQVVRVRLRRELVTRQVPYATDQQPDGSLPQGQTRLLRPGVPGVQVLDYVVTLHDGVPVSRRLVGEATRAQPVAELVAVGTATPPPAATAPASVADLNWPALASCESGGNPRAVSPNGDYRGLYQFSMATWHSLGGSGDPIDASAQEQTYRAELLYERDGTAPWPVCGSRLYS